MVHYIGVALRVHPSLRSALEFTMSRHAQTRIRPTPRVRRALALALVVAAAPLLVLTSCDDDSVAPGPSRGSSRSIPATARPPMRARRPSSRSACGSRRSRGRGWPGSRCRVAVTQGGGSLPASSAATDANGIATPGRWTMGRPGPQEVRASVPGLDTVVFRATSLGVPAEIAIVAGADQQGPVATALAVPPEVLVTDSSGTPLARDFGDLRARRRRARGQRGSAHQRPGLRQPGRLGRWARAPVPTAWSPAWKATKSRATRSGSKRSPWPGRSRDWWPPKATGRNRNPRYPCESRRARGPRTRTETPSQGSWSTSPQAATARSCRPRWRQTRKGSRRSGYGSSAPPRGRPTGLPRAPPTRTRRPRRSSRRWPRQPSTTSKSCT